jgi:hypothetical protein
VDVFFNESKRFPNLTLALFGQATKKVKRLSNRFNSVLDVVAWPLRSRTHYPLQAGTPCAVNNKSDSDFHR